MELAPSVRKMKSAGGELIFSTVGEGVRALLSRTAGKLLLVSDGEGCNALAPFAHLSRTISVVLTGDDALPLFSMPDGVGAVFAAGGRDCVIAARLFANLRRIPCSVAPASSAQDGVFCKCAEATVGGVVAPYTLENAQIIYDDTLLAPSLAEGYARLLLGRLACFESRALRCLMGKGTVCEDAFALLSRLPADLSAEEIVQSNARLRVLEEAGAPVGEGIVLAREYGKGGAFRAFWELSALYGAFFARGKPRRYVVPDYCRKELAPTAEEYARRALSLERRRGDLAREFDLIAGRRTDYLRTYGTLAGAPFRYAGSFDALKRFAQETDGLCAVIRDFGLLEEV